MQCDTYATKQEAQQASQQAARREEREWANHRKAVDKAMQDLQATQDRWCTDPAAWKAVLDDMKATNPHTPYIEYTKPNCRPGLIKDPKEALKPVGDTRGAPSFQ